MDLTPQIPFLTGAAARDPKRATEIAETMQRARAMRVSANTVYESYLAGDHAQRFDTEDVKTEFGKQIRGLVVNWPKLLIDVRVQRLGVKFFSLPYGGEGDTDVNGADEVAWGTWRFNKMPRREKAAYRTAMALGEVAIHVTAGKPHPRWSIEHPSQTIVAVDPESGEVSAALKEWTEGTGLTARRNVTLWLPGVIWRFEYERTSTAAQTLWVPTGTGGYEQGAGGLIPRRDVDVAINTGMDVVPFVRLVNDEDLFGVGSSDLAAVIPLVDALNKLLRDMIVASDFAALPQRWVAGVQAPVDPVTGEKVPLEKALKSTKRILNLGRPEASIGQLAAADGKWHINAMELVEKMIAAVSQTPAGYYDQSVNPPSANSVDAQEAPLLSLLDGKAASFGVSWNDAQRLGHILAGSEQGEVFEGETVWNRMQRRTLSEQTDAFQKLTTTDLSLESALEIAFDYGPERIERELRRLNFPTEGRRRQTATDGDQTGGDEPPVESAA